MKTGDFETTGYATGNVDHTNHQTHNPDVRCTKIRAHMDSFAKLLFITSYY